MKPNDKAYREFMRVYNKTHVSLEAQVMASLTAAYAAQFQGTDYADLVARLRKTSGMYQGHAEIATWTINPDGPEAADAIEALLADRDGLKELLPNQNHESRAPIPTDWWSVAVLERRKRIAAEKERDALLACLNAAANRLEKLAGDMRPPNSVTPQLFMLVNSMRQNMQQSDHNARLAPVDDDALVEIVADAIETRTKLYGQARAAIAAIRPHIEAAERERCAKAAKGRYEKLVPANEAARNFRLGRMTAAYEIEGKLKPSKTPPDTNTAQIDVREFVEKLDAPQQSGAGNE